MDKRFPTTPFATGLSRSAKETERRIRNIFSGPKQDPPKLLVVLAALGALLCGNLVSCQEAKVPDNSLPDSSQGMPGTPLARKTPEVKPVLTARDLAPDLNQNGIPEEIRLENEFGWNEARFYEGDQLLVRRVLGDYLCTLDGVDYLMRCHLDEHQGSYHYSYSLSDFSGEFEEQFQWNSVSFDTNFTAPFHKEFKPEEIAAFLEELNGLLSHSVRLVERDGELLAEGDLSAELPWLDAFPERFARDPEKSLLENLEAFEAAMPPAWTPLAPREGAKLPIDRPLELAFLSGAGAWQTQLTLNPDGTFTGDYQDADMNIRYVCRFHGSFRVDGQLTPASWQLTLEELVLDTGRPVGVEWIEDEVLYFSSCPYGFDPPEGGMLEPGALFLLYTPEARGHAPGTELYGAEEFWGWWQDRREFKTAADTLGCWGLHNLTSGYGFFSYDWVQPAG